MPSIARQLQDWRARHQLSQSQAAAQLGVNVRSIQNWEQGVSEPLGLARVALLQAIAPAKKTKRKP